MDQRNDYELTVKEKWKTEKSVVEDINEMAIILEYFPRIKIKREMSINRKKKIKDSGSFIIKTVKMTKRDIHKHEKMTLELLVFYTL